MDGEEISKLIEAAKGGDKSALASLIVRAQDHIHGLALRFLWNEEDAKEATQEILIKIVTHLSHFRRESRFSTWCYRIATHHLLDIKKSAIEKMKLNHEAFEEDLHSGLAEPSEEMKNDPQYPVLLEEVRIGCTTAMLNCLDRKHRITYIIGEILEIDSTEAAFILDLSSSTFRKRLERARKLVEDFSKRVCGIIDTKNRCKCGLRLSAAVQQGRVAKNHFAFARARADHAGVVKRIQEFDALRRTISAYRTGVAFRSPVNFALELRSFLESIR